jgi:tRNA pseudouridine38-40 synthase
MGVGAGFRPPGGTIRNRIRRTALRPASGVAVDAPTTFRGTVSYDGTDFSGWQVQTGRRTVQGALQEALSTILGAPVSVLAAGRTDAGVHAEGQVISFRAVTRIPPAGIAAAANALLPEDAAILDLAEAPPSFHATFDATGKVYRYEILSGRIPRPLLRRTTWRVPGRLDLRRMRAAARLLVGRRDFRSFRTNPGPGEDRGSTVRTLRRVDVRRRGERVLVEVEGDGFLYNMVRAIVGTLVQVGRGTWPPERVGEALRARDRRAAGPTAPPRGLTLVSVSYPAGGVGRRRGKPRGKIGPARRARS